MPVTVNNEPDYETYLHRIGRCGRFGRLGMQTSLLSSPSIDFFSLGYVFNFISSKNEWRIVKSIEQYFNFTIDEITIEGISELEFDPE